MPDPTNDLRAHALHQKSKEPPDVPRITAEEAAVVRYFLLLTDPEFSAEDLCRKDLSVATHPERCRAALARYEAEREMAIKEAAWAETRANYRQACCADCCRTYGDENGFPDLVIPLDAWLAISPTGHEGGLLCPSCMCKRAERAGLKNVPARFKSGPFYTEEEGRG